MPADHQRAIRHHGSPSQSRAGAGTEKKRQELGPLQATPQKSAEAYEVLRSQALHPEDHRAFDSDRIVLMRHGMAAWIRKAESHSPISPTKQKPVIVDPKTSTPKIAEEVAGLMAEIIIKSERFAIHA